MPAIGTTKPRKTLSRLGHHRILGMKIVGIVAAVCLWSSAAMAGVLLASSRTSVQFFSTPGDATFFLSLNNSEAKILNFITTKANQQVAITFSASCDLSPSSDTLVGVQILVNPAGSVGEFVAPPTNHRLGSAVCGDRRNDGDIAGTTVVAIARPAKAGTNTVRVRLVYSSFGASSVSIYALSLSVIS